MSFPVEKRSLQHLSDEMPTLAVVVDRAWFTVSAGSVEGTTWVTIAVTKKEGETLGATVPSRPAGEQKQHGGEDCHA